MSTLPRVTGVLLMGCLCALSLLSPATIRAAETADKTIKPEDGAMRLLRQHGRARLVIRKEFDKDHNGVLDAQERVQARRHVQALRRKEVADLVLESDKNKDGKVAKDEMTDRREERIQALDKNKDGFVDKQEAEEQKATDILKDDKNLDGKVSKEELTDPRDERMKFGDLNQDGFIDRAEAEEVAFRPRSEPPKELTERKFDQAEQLQPSAGSNPGGGLYDEGLLRTLFFQFENDHWLAEMSDFYHTDVSVPADLMVDGALYRGVGVRYRGNSSFFFFPPELKRSLEVDLDLSVMGQRLYGYRTLNLHNGAEDPTFLREMLYLKICRQYMPAFKANLVKVVINGESWGIYPNVQQYNSDFIKEWFGSNKGVRWKIATGPGKKGLTYEGPDKKNYQGYSLKSENAPASALDDLINLCRVLNKTPDDQLESTLDSIFNIDGALWDIALENIFVDEGYIVRGMDYDLFQDAQGRFHLLQHDGNEVFNIPHGPGLPPGFDPTKLDPFHKADSKDVPVLSRLLAVPHLRARYVAHYRTIMDEWFHWEKLEPFINQHRALIDAEVKKDVRKIFTYEDFAKGHLEDVNKGEARGIKSFVERRREFLTKHPGLATPAPEILSVSFAPTNARPTAGRAVRFEARTTGTVKAQVMNLFWSTNRLNAYQRVTMFDDGRHGDGEADDGFFTGEIPAQPGDTRVQYYVEARSERENLASAFHPAKASAGPLTYLVSPAPVGAIPVVINEIMPGAAAKTKGGGAGEDWIELRNLSDREIDLAGMHLTDEPTRPRKWAFPPGSRIPASGCLVIWAGPNPRAGSGLYASFKLSRKGETLQLTDTEARGNRVLDEVKFGKLNEGQAFARQPDGGWTQARPTPGQLN